MEKKNKTEISLLDIAETIERGFSQVATKEDLKLMFEEMKEMHSDVRQIKSTVDMLVRSDSGQDVEIRDLTKRVVRLEGKAGWA